MAWIDLSYLQNRIGSGQVTALGLGTAAIFAQFELEARSTVLSTIQYAGYSDPGTTLTASIPSTGFLQKLTAAVMVRDAYAARTGIQLPASLQDMIAEGTTMLDAVYNKRLPIPGMSPSTRDGYGGSKFSPRSAYSTGARVPVFTTLRGSGY